MSKSENGIFILAGLAGLFMVLTNKTFKIPGLGYTQAEAAALAARIVQENGFNADPQMLAAMAMIESSGNPLALRYEAGINDASIGLMQTLSGTARWLATDMGYSKYGVPDIADLTKAEVSMYFGAAYVHWLSNYKGQARSEDWIVQSYNGGPGANNPMTRNHLAKYRAARYGTVPAPTTDPVFDDWGP